MYKDYYNILGPLHVKSEGPGGDYMLIPSVLSSECPESGRR